jgi:hypothetical protein
MGVNRICVSNHATKSAERKREQRKRWFRNGQKWRTGCEGRISVVKRRNGLSRCHYKGFAGMHNVVNIGRAIAKQDGALEPPSRQHTAGPNSLAGSPPARFAFLGSIDNGAANVNFAPESS